MVRKKRVVRRAVKGPMFSSPHCMEDALNVQLTWKPIVPKSLVFMGCRDDGKGGFKGADGRVDYETGEIFGFRHHGVTVHFEYDYRP